MIITKMQGLGNDFIVIDNRKGIVEDPEGLAKRICKRRVSVGADGLILIENSSKADIRMRIFNYDGSEAEMCGNGIRVFTKYVYDKKILPLRQFGVETLAGIMYPNLLNNGLVEVDMGSPSFVRSDIPMLGEGSPLHQIIEVAGKEIEISSVLMGVPHTVVLVEEITDALVTDIGSILELHPMFPRKTNVNFVQMLHGEDVKVRTWERGVGRTLACGTGCAAVFVVLHALGKVQSHMTAKLGEGDMLLCYKGEDVFMTGPAEYVMEGTLLG